MIFSVNNKLCQLHFNSEITFFKLYHKLMYIYRINIIPSNLISMNVFKFSKIKLTHINHNAPIFDPSPKLTRFVIYYKSIEKIIKIFVYVGMLHMTHQFSKIKWFIINHSKLMWFIINQSKKQLKYLCTLGCYTWYIHIIFYK